MCSFDGDDFDDVEEDEGLDDLENAEEVSTEPWDPLCSPSCQIAPPVMADCMPLPPVCGQGTASSNEERSSPG